MVFHDEDQTIARLASGCAPIRVGRRLLFVEIVLLIEAGKQ